jgi:hypothetical protein
MQALGKWELNGSGMPYRQVYVYNATGGTLTKGAVYAVSVSGASATTHNPRLLAPAAVGGRAQQWVVALEAAANNSWARVCDWGYCSALVEGTTDVTLDDALVPVSGQTYLVKAGGGGGSTIAEALVGQTANSAVLAAIFLRGGESPMDTGSVQYAETSIANTPFLAIRATPAELVAAPGAGKVLEFVSCVILFDYTAAYTETDDNLVVRYASTTGAIASDTIEMTGFVDATADAIAVGYPAASVVVLKSVAENAALVLHGSGSGEFGGGNAANVIRVKTAYRIHQTSF